MNGKMKKSYRPLFIIVALIVLAATVPVYLRSSVKDLILLADIIPNIMAGYFLVFGGFKLLDLKGFAQGYAMYDLLAKRIRVYGYIYPFIEFALGLAYVARFHLEIVNWITFILMIFGAAGVVSGLKKTKGMKCVCLGTVINLPLTTVTLIENLLMGLMALMMLGLFS